MKIAFNWKQLGTGRDVHQFPFVEKLGKVPSVPGFRPPGFCPRRVRGGLVSV